MRLIATLAKQARKHLEAHMLESDFGWMRLTKLHKGLNPRTTRTSCFYDFTRGELGTLCGGRVHGTGAMKTIMNAPNCGSSASLIRYPGVADGL